MCCVFYLFYFYCKILRNSNSFVFNMDYSSEIRRKQMFIHFQFVAGKPYADKISDITQPIRPLHKYIK